MAAPPYQFDSQDEVAERVLRRAHVSKMTRALQDRLALASVKIQNGWENMSLDAIEPQIEQRYPRKRPASSNDNLSDTASTTSTRLHSSSGLDSSPLTAPMFSGGSNYSFKRLRPTAPADTAKYPSSGAMTGRRTRQSTRAQIPSSWKKQHNLSQSSPIKQEKHAHFPATNPTQLSFISEGSTIPDRDTSPESSEDDPNDLALHSFNFQPPTQIISSPPRTPPPGNRLRNRKAQNVSWSRTPKNGEEGADLLMYLAASPSPAQKSGARTIVQAPTTPPCKSTPLPSSHMTPSTNGAAWGFAPTTPGNNFDFSDFVNITPSPAQAAWNRTPATATRRRLNFDSLAPPTSSSPNMTRSNGNSNKQDGVGMELGGELVS
ncbi:hypothetical protein MBLNU230_g1387t1 [Neophaeotheca triangularis]